MKLTNQTSKLVPLGFIYALVNPKTKEIFYIGVLGMYLNLLVYVMIKKFKIQSKIKRPQGSSYDKVFVDLVDILRCRDSMLLRQLEYVALSRTRSDAIVYQRA